MIFSLGPKMSRTKFFKKVYLPGDKRFWAIFFRTMECDKPQWTICNGPKNTLIISLEVIGASFQDLRGC